MDKAVESDEFSTTPSSLGLVGNPQFVGFNRSKYTFDMNKFRFDMVISPQSLKSSKSSLVRENVVCEQLQLSSFGEDDDVPSRVISSKVDDSDIFTAALREATKRDSKLIGRDCEVMKGSLVVVTTFISDLSVEKKRLRESALMKEGQL